MPGPTRFRLLEPREEMSQGPLMPKATAVWLVENTSLSFEQIAEFCKLHPLEVKGIADGEVAAGIKGLDPITTNQLTRDEIEKAQKAPHYRLKAAVSKVKLPEVKRTTKGPRYTPLSRRQDRPNAILWLLRSHPELKDSQIIRLVGTTKSTIQQIRERTHWNSGSLQPLDPVTLGLTTQINLDFEVQKAAADRPAALAAEGGASLLPTEVSTQREPEHDEDDHRGGRDEKLDADSVFAKLKGRHQDEDDDED